MQTEPVSTNTRQTKVARDQPKTESALASTPWGPICYTMQHTVNYVWRQSWHGAGLLSYAVLCAPSVCECVTRVFLRAATRCDSQWDSV